jgi:hypothetical protein
MRISNISSPDELVKLGYDTTNHYVFFCFFFVHCALLLKFISSYFHPYNL